ncbi:DMT family transporter [Paracoccus shanxieyensis]|uniref:EamA family transporter n=1 Tax=Paracoccus shanxieyensis TaxID=2675752 RepID=A0A6L6J7U0_9RHOB|nr:DMT family transporter [Paracoccus shanxieyensis]MTH66714.1 EamA family transporter [Paracoccus shanxieyensis]MTH89949.1 EamA family transporter [Paracoccus shanxieyensis]
MQKSLAGWGSGLVGVVIFSGSLPATRIAIGGFSPMFLTSARAVIAALVGSLLLFALRETRPERRDLPALVLVAAGVVVGFPLLTAMALQHISAARSVMFIGILPLFTALFGVLRCGERPRPAFWLFSGCGSLVIVAYALAHGGEGSLVGDPMMFAAVALCGLGYAEGAALSRRLGGWQVISWSLVLSLPIMAALSFATLPASAAGITAPEWAALGYVSLFSMLLGFVFWYRGLAIGGIAGVGQLQLLQPFFGLLLAAVLIGDAVTPAMLAITLVVVGCVWGAKRYS